ncbi:MAG: UDP-N-acetylmuramoyl-tripeptide--D-alanyl-D-alanine ligase, partial [Polaromonas sp.]|nr:UDP-N-acetylmuramoyl-tripeptide--D-alanyl-D-alanine ligase [Polaromonas sp.]
EKFDAHDFLPQAAAQGAVAALATHGLAAAGLPGLEVADTRLALGQLAAAWRSQFEVPLIAVTGSNGKTTVTQMVASILRAWKSTQALATEGNFNNDIGVPLTLLRLRASHAVGVVELGMNHPGEIAYLAKLVQPTVALVNNAQREHLEFMQTVDAVAHENGSVLQALPAQGTAVFPADDSYSPVWRQLAGKCNVMTFAASGDADVVGTADWAQDHWQVSATTPVGSLGFPLYIAGRHNVKNALAAVACAVAVGTPLTAIAQGLGEFVPVKGRSRALSVRVRGQQITLVDDTYNANPDSMQAAIEVLAELPAPRMLVMGDMGEVGDQGPQFHEEAGALARLRGIHTLLTLGEQSVHAQRAFDAAAGSERHFHDMASLVAAVQAALPGVQSVLVKGSRFMKMELVIDAIEQADDAAARLPTLPPKDLSHVA